MVDQLNPVHIEQNWNSGPGRVKERLVVLEQMIYIRTSLSEVSPVYSLGPVPGLTNESSIEPCSPKSPMFSWV